MIAAVAAILILASVVLPRLASDTQGVMDTRKVAHHLAADLRYTRRLAMTNGGQHQLKIDVTLSPVIYTIINLSNSSQVDETRTIPDTISRSGDTTVTFNTDGTATANSTLTLTGPTDTYTLYVFATTGATQLKKTS